MRKLFTPMVRKLKYFSCGHIKPESKMYNVFDIKSDFEGCVNLAVKTMKTGGIIALPTDTLYGLACNAMEDDAIQKLYRVKGRSFTKPIGICVHNIESIGRYGKVSHLPISLLGDLLPGPVTIVVQRAPGLNSSLNPNLNNVAIRIPESNFIRDITKKMESPLALTSANRSNEKSSVKIEEFSSIWSSIDAIFSGGDLGCERGGSTIVDLTNPGYSKILREGSYLTQTLKILQNYNINFI